MGSASLSRTACYRAGPALRLSIAGLTGADTPISNRGRAVRPPVSRLSLSLSLSLSLPTVPAATAPSSHWSMREGKAASGHVCSAALRQAHVRATSLRQKNVIVPPCQAEPRRAPPCLIQANTSLPPLFLRSAVRVNLHTHYRIYGHPSKCPSIVLGPGGSSRSTAGPFATARAWPAAVRRMRAPGCDASSGRGKLGLVADPALRPQPARPPAPRPRQRCTHRPAPGEPAPHRTHTQPHLTLAVESGACSTPLHIPTPVKWGVLISAFPQGEGEWL